MPFNERGQENLDKAKAQAIANKFNAGQPTSGPEINFVMSRGYGGLLNSNLRENIINPPPPKTTTPVATETVAIAKEPHGVNVGGSDLYATPSKENVISLEPSFTTMATDFGKRGQTINTKPMDIIKTVDTFHFPSDIGIKGQTVDTRSVDVTVAKPEVTTGILQALQTSRADILRGQGLELPPRSAAMALADFGIVGEAVGGFISPVENLVLLVGKFAKNPTMEKVMYNPTAFGVPVQAATSFFKGALTGQQIERSSVDVQAQFLREHPVYAGTTVIGDIFLGWVSGKVVSEVGGKISNYWNRSYKGSGMEMSRIAKGTTVTPEGQTIYSGYAGKQAARLAPELVDVPGSNPITHVSVTSSGLSSPEIEAADLAFDMGTSTPHASAFLYSKMVDKTLPTLAMARSLPSELPLMGLVGDKLVEIPEAPEIATEMPTYRASGKEFIRDFTNPSETLPFKGFGPSGTLTTVDLTRNALASSVKSLPTIKELLKSQGGEASLQQLSRSVENVSRFLSSFGTELAAKSGSQLLASGASVLGFSALTSNRTIKSEPASPRPYVELVPKKLSSTILFPQVTQNLTISNKNMSYEENKVMPSLAFLTMQEQKSQTKQTLKTITSSYTAYSLKTFDLSKTEESLSPISIHDLSSMPISIVAPASISAQTASLKQALSTNTILTTKNAYASTFPSAPSLTPILPVFKLPNLGGSGMGVAKGGGFGKWFKLTHPVLEPKQVWKQFWNMPKLSVSRLRTRGKRNKVTVTKVGSRKKRSRKK